MLQLNATAGGLYTIHAVINHACDPNVIVDVKDGSSHLQLIALRDIAVGEEYTAMYVDGTQRRIPRRHQLKRQYMFDCNCDKCEREARSHLNTVQLTVSCAVFLAIVIVRMACP